MLYLKAMLKGSMPCLPFLIVSWNKGLHLRQATKWHSAFQHKGPALPTKRTNSPTEQEMSGIAHCAR